MSTEAPEHGTADLLDFLAKELQTLAPPAAYPHHQVDELTRSILDLINGDPLHAADRERIVTAIVAEANETGGQVNPNAVRARLTNPGGDLTVYPRLIGAVYQGLATRGVLEFVGWTTNTDTRGRNAGRPARTYRLTREPQES